jgi:hypothetical protein
VGILEEGPLWGPIALKEGVPTNTVLSSDCSTAATGVSERSDGFTIEPSFDGFKDDNHDFKVGLVGF